MLISEIIAEVIGDVGEDSDNTGLSTLALTWVKGALRRMSMFTRSRLFKTTSTLTVSGSSASLSTGFLRETKVYRKSGGSDIEIEKHPNFKTVVNTSTTGTPLYYEIIGSTIYFDKSISESVYVEYFKEIDSVAAGDTWSYSTPIMEVLKDGIKYYYYKYTEESEDAREALALFKAGLDKSEEDFIIDESPGHINES